jgi:hypothetical protein
LMPSVRRRCAKARHGLRFGPTAAPVNRQGGAVSQAAGRPRAPAPDDQ